MVPIWSSICSKFLGIEYVALNPGSSFRGIHDSLVNYESGHKPNPEMILCCHEEIAVAVAHGYAKATGKIMPAIVHNVVGLQHASMAIYNAWCDHTPVMVMGGTGPMNSSKRRPWIDWIHTAQVQGNLVRDFVKWDDQPVGVEAFPSSIMRGYRIAMSDPGGPVYLCFDVTDQEAAIEKEIPLPDPKRFRPPAPLQADYDAIKEAAQLLASAQNPVILADYVGRNNDAVMSLVALADLLSIPVIDFGARLNFPNTHSLNLTGRNRELIANADVIMGLDMTDLYGALVRSDPNTHANVPATKPGCKVINVTLKDIVVRSWTSDFQELAPVDLPIVANTRVFLPALAEEIRKQGKFSKSVVEDRRKAMAAQHEEVHARWQADLKKALGRAADRAAASCLGNLGSAQKRRLAAGRRRFSRLAEPAVDLGQARAVSRRLRRRRIGLRSGRVGGRVAALSRHRQDLRQSAARRRDAVHAERPVDCRQYRRAAADRDDQQSGLLQRRGASGKGRDPPRPAGGEQTRGYGNGQAAGGLCQLGAHFQRSRRGADHRTGADSPGGGTGDQGHQRRKTTGAGRCVYADGVIDSVQVVPSGSKCANRWLRGDFMMRFKFVSRLC